MKTFIIGFSVFLCLFCTTLQVDAQVVSGNTVAAQATNALVYGVQTPIASYGTIDQQLDVKTRAVQLQLDAGDVYQLGTSNWSATMQVNLVFKKSTTVLRTVPVTLTIDKTNPEHLFIVEYQDLFDVTGVDVTKGSYSVSVGAYTAATLNPKIRLTTTLVDDVKRGIYSKFGTLIEPANLKATRVVEAGAVSKAIFSWDVGANRQFTSYDLQILKVEPYANGDVFVNWSQAASIEVNDVSYEMTLAEGTGFYLWRVRPIGSYFAGDRTFWKNLGKWSTHVTGGVATQFFSGGSPTAPQNSGKILNTEMTGVVGNYFYYTQFDDNKNFSYTKTLTENSRQSEQITYANGLNQVQQVQKHLFSNDKVVGMQTVYDYVGRPSLQSLPAPISKNSLGYAADLFNPLGQTRTYNASDFDENSNYQTPSKVDGTSYVGKYYSDGNTDNAYVPDAEGYPYIRSGYFADPLNKVNRQAAPGNTKKIDHNFSSTKNTLTFYDAVSQDELDILFGNEAPLDTTVYKIITVDPNKVASVQYKAYSGEVLATCLDDAIDTELLPVGNERSMTVENVFPKSNFVPGDRVANSRKTLVVTNPIGMTVGLHYKITPKTFGISCEAICKACDYKVEIQITSQLEPQVKGKNLKISFNVDPASLTVADCNTPLSTMTWGSGNFQNITYTEPSGTEGTSFGFSNGQQITSIVLPQGAYIIEKRVYVNNVNVNQSSYYDLAKQELFEKSQAWTAESNCCGPLTIDVSNYDCDSKPLFCDQTSNAFLSPTSQPFIDFVNLVVADLKKEQTASYKQVLSSNLVSSTLVSSTDDQVTFDNAKTLLIQLNTEFSCQQIGDCYKVGSALLKQNVIQAALPGAHPTQTYDDNGNFSTPTTSSSSAEIAPEYEADFDMIQSMFECLGYKHGLTGDYYYRYQRPFTRTLENGLGSKLIKTKTDLVMDFRWFYSWTSTGKSPAGGIPYVPEMANWGARWTGYIDIPSDVTALNFYFNDAIKVWMDEDRSAVYGAPNTPPKYFQPIPVIDVWQHFNEGTPAGEIWYPYFYRARTMNVNTTGNAGTVAPGKHHIRIDYFQGYADANLAMKWVRNGVEEVVPYAYLYPKGSECNSYTDVVMYNDPSYLINLSNPNPNTLYVLNTDQYSQFSTNSTINEEYLRNGKYTAGKSCLYTYFKNIPVFTSVSSASLTTYDPLLSSSIQEAASKVCGCLNTVVPPSNEPNMNAVSAPIQPQSLCYAGCEQKRPLFEEAINNFVIQANFNQGLFDATSPLRKTYDDFFPNIERCCLIDLMVDDCVSKCGLSNVKNYLDTDRILQEAAPGYTPSPYSITVGGVTYNYASYTEFFNSTLFYDLQHKDYKDFDLAYMGSIDAAPVGTYTKGGDLLYIENQITGTVYAGLDKGIRDRKATDMTDPNHYKSVTAYDFVADLSDPASSTPKNRSGKIEVVTEWDPNSLTDRYDDVFIQAQINLYINGSSTAQEKFILNNLPANYFLSDVLTTQSHILEFYFDNQHQIHVVPKSAVAPYADFSNAPNFLPSAVSATRKIVFADVDSEADDVISVSLHTPTGIVNLSNDVTYQGVEAGLVPLLTQSINAKVSAPDFVASIAPGSGNTTLVINVPAYSHSTPIDEYDLVVNAPHPGDFTIDNAWTKSKSLVTLLNDYGSEVTYSSSCPFGYNILGPGVQACGTNAVDEDSYIYSRLDGWGANPNDLFRDAQGGYGFTRMESNPLAERPQVASLVMKPEYRISLSQPFERNFKVNFGSRNQFGADGLMFVIAGVPSFPPLSMSGAGATLGYYNGSYPAGQRGVAYSLGIEFDTYVNNYSIGPEFSGFQDIPEGKVNCLPIYTGETGYGNCADGQDCGYCKDVDYDHITVWQGEMGTRYAPGGVQIPTVPIKYSAITPYHATDVEDGQYHDVKVAWSSSESKLRIYFDGDLRTEIPVANPAAFFNTPDGKVTLGWLGSAWLTNQQSVIPLPVPGETTCTVCARWEHPSNQDVNIVASGLLDFPPMVPITCESALQEYVTTQTEYYLDNCLTTKTAELKNNYTQNCLSAIDDEFSLTYDLGYHHYTLYHYDRAGNMIRTVPPDGVQFLDATARAKVKLYRQNPLTNIPVFPLHRQVTRYNYNSIKQAISSFNPDGGETKFWYNAVGQLVLSQNEQQRYSDTYTYNAYDNLGRIIEIAELSNFTPTFIDEYNQVIPANFSLPGGATKQQQILTVYSTAADVLYGKNEAQVNITNRISYTKLKNLSGSIITTYYSYDPHGNVQWLIQDLGDIGRKTIRYEYDLVSNNVNKVIYQEGKQDQFMHRYAYDEDNRIISMHTSQDGISWTKETKYNYYLHGALSRAEIGQDKIQGADYVYTIEGYLKSINQSDLNSTTEPGHDTPGALYDGFLKDEFAMELVYFNGDYKRTGVAIGVGNANIAASVTTGFTNLYNGNIAAFASNIRSGSTHASSPYGLNIRHFQYDKLNRLRDSRFRNNTGSWSSISNKGSETFTYTGNGNILRSDRWNYNATQIDGLYYSYETTLGWNTDYLDNRVTSVGDSYSGSSVDLQPGQGVNNYVYDLNGNLITDAQEGLSITWNLFNKIATVLDESNTSNKRYLVFDYDAVGNRIRKTEYTYWNTAGQLMTSTIYVNDASGKIMAVYKKDATSVTWLETPLYGSSRVGLLKPQLTIPADVPVAPSVVQNFEGINTAPYHSQWGGTIYNTVSNPVVAAPNISTTCARVTKGWWGDYVKYDISQLKVNPSQPIKIDFMKQIAGTQKIYVLLGNKPEPYWGWPAYKPVEFYAQYSADLTAAANTWQTVTFANPTIMDNTVDPTTLKYLYVFIDPDNNAVAAYQKYVWFDNISLNLIPTACSDTYEHTSELNNTIVASLPEYDLTGKTVIFDTEPGVSQFSSPNMYPITGSKWTSGYMLYSIQNPDKEGINQSHQVYTYGRGDDPFSGVGFTFPAGQTIPDASTYKFTMDVYDHASPSAISIVAYKKVGGVETEYGTYRAVTTVSNTWETVEFILDPASVVNPSLAVSQVNKLNMYFDPGIIYRYDDGQFKVFDCNGNNNATFVTSGNVTNYNASTANPFVASTTNSSSTCVKATKNGGGSYIMYDIQNLQINPSGTVYVDLYKTNATSRPITVMLGYDATPSYGDYSEMQAAKTVTLSATNDWQRLTFSGFTLYNTGPYTPPAKYIYIFFDPASTNTGVDFYVDNITVTSLNIKPASKTGTDRLYLMDNLIMMPAAANPLISGGLQLFNNGSTFSANGITGQTPQHIPSGQTTVAEFTEGGYAFSFMTSNVFNSNLPKGVHGLKADYYNASNVLQTSVRIANVNRSWTRAQDPFNTGQDFRAVYSGYIYIPQNGSYTFSIPGLATSTGTLYLDGNAVLVKASTTDIGTTGYTVTSTLTQGLHEFKLDALIDVTLVNASELVLSWITPFEPRYKVIDKQYFYVNNNIASNYLALDSRHGLKTTFYNSMSETPSAIQLVRQDPVIDMKYSYTDVNYPGGYGSDKTVTWEGYLFAPYGGTYTFYTNAIYSNCFFYLDGVTAATSATTSSAIYLAQGIHKLKFTAKTTYGPDMGCKLEWQLPPGFAGVSNQREGIPAQFLYAENPTVSFLFDQSTGTSIDLIDPANKIEASEECQIIAAPIPDAAGEYYLITGKEKNIYYHRIRKNGSTFEIVSKNNKLNWNIGAGYVPVVCEDYALASYVNVSKSENNRLFIATRETREGKYRLQQLLISSLQNYNTELTSTAQDGCVDLSEAQISPDGTRLAVNMVMVNPASTTRWLHRFVEYAIDPKDVSTTFSAFRDIMDETRDNTYIYGTDSSPRKSIVSFDFSPDGRYIYFLAKNLTYGAAPATWYNKVYSGAVGLHMLRYETGTTPVFNNPLMGALTDTWVRANSFNGSMRRAKDGKLYITRDDRCVNMGTLVTTTTAKSMIVLSNVNYGLTPVRSTVTYHAGAVIGGNMPLQPHRVRVVPCTNNPYSSKRIVGKRVYELTDHLGNVRVVVGDTRLATVIANSLSDQKVDIHSYTDYYGFGMVFREQISDGYRYGFNGKEKDDELKGNGNSYDFGARIYDPRLGRFLSLDKKKELYPSHTPYHYSLDNPIYFLDSDGNIVRDANGNPISLRQKADGGFEIVGEFIGKDADGKVVDMTRHKQFYEALLRTSKGTAALQRIINVQKEVNVVFEGKVLDVGHAYTTNDKKDITIHMGIPSADFKSYDNNMFDNIVGTHEILGHIGPNGEQTDRDHDTNAKSATGSSESPSMTEELENSVEYYIKFDVDLSTHPTERYEYYMKPGVDKSDQITPEQKENFKTEFKRVEAETRKKLSK